MEKNNEYTCAMCKKKINKKDMFTINGDPFDIYGHSNKDSFYIDICVSCAKKVKKFIKDFSKK